jgi:SNF2 family DNA or RNA helicase
MQVRGPFLILAPLSTLGHWKREFDDWTDMNAVYYHDVGAGGEGRALIREHDWYYTPTRGRDPSREGIYKFNVLITSYQCLMSDWEYLSTIKWRYVVVDEVRTNRERCLHTPGFSIQRFSLYSVVIASCVSQAHALKNQRSQLQQALRRMKYDSLTLLTGTPLQNDVQVWPAWGPSLSLTGQVHPVVSCALHAVLQELFSLLTLINPERFSSLPAFVQQFGELRGGRRSAVCPCS